MESPLTPAASGYDVPQGVEIRGRFDREFAKILARDALQFVAGLQREFRTRIKYSMECRREAKRQYNDGGLPGFDPATKYIREGDWTCAPVPPSVADRRVEITGPVERKMIINALNSGAKVFMVATTIQFTMLVLSLLPIDDLLYLILYRLILKMHSRLLGKI